MTRISVIAWGVTPKLKSRVSPIGTLTRYFREVKKCLNSCNGAGDFQSGTEKRKKRLWGSSICLFQTDLLNKASFVL